MEIYHNVDEGVIVYLVNLRLNVIDFCLNVIDFSWKILLQG